MIAIKTDKTVEVRDLQSGKLLKGNVTSRSSQSYGNDETMQFSPDGRLLAIPQDDRLELWDVSDLR